MEELKALYPHRYNKPKISGSAYCAPGSHVHGDVWVGDYASVWFGAVMRGDVNYIRVGNRSNVQDNSVVHVTYKGHPTIIGDDVTIGHSVVLHSCTVGNHALIGMGSVVLDGAEIGEFVMLGAGSLVTQNTKIPAGMTAFGRPAKVVSAISDEERAFLEFSAKHYVKVARTYRSV